MRDWLVRDQVIVVTGGSKGIGLATARELVERGARVAILARNQAGIDRAMEQLGRERAMGLAVDVCRKAEVQSAFDAVVERWQRIDGLINNVGFQFSRSLELMPEEELRMMLDVNFFSAVFGCQCVLPIMRRQGGGRIVNVSSASVRHDNEFADLGIYSAAKAALDHFTDELREDAKQDNIMVTLFSPGGVATGSVANFDPEAIAAAFEKWQRKGETFDGACEVADIAQAMAHCFEYPDGVAVEFMEVRANRPTKKALETDW